MEGGDAAFGKENARLSEVLGDIEEAVRHPDIDDFQTLRSVVLDVIKAAQNPS